MCAKADFSGYHAFATNMADHLKNAHAFHEALNQTPYYEIMFEFTTQIRVRYGEVPTRWVMFTMVITPSFTRWRV